MEKLISPYQSNFLKGRGTSDNVIIIQEIMNHFQKLIGRRGKLLLKIDLEKAFDRQEWYFIYRALLFFKFPQRITKIIMICVRSSRITILINGSKTEFFHPTRGIRQGELMSPYLFILFMEPLSKYIGHQVNIAYETLFNLTIQGHPSLIFSMRMTLHLQQTLIYYQFRQ